jgi:RES domain-containing protein
MRCVECGTEMGTASVCARCGAPVPGYLLDNLGDQTPSDGTPTVPAPPGLRPAKSSQSVGTWLGVQRGVPRAAVAWSSALAILLIICVVGIRLEQGTAARPAQRAAARPALTGFGATLAQWNHAHKMDPTVHPTSSGYLPMIDGTDTWQGLTLVDGRVVDYALNVAPSSLQAAEARARLELPADAKQLWSHTFGANCSMEQFQSATLLAVLGDGQVNVEFFSADTAESSPVTEELFSMYDAQTVAQAPTC